MGQSSIIAPVDSSALAVLLFGALLAAIAQLISIYVRSDLDDNSPSRLRVMANLGAGALSGFVFGTLFLAAQANPIPAQIVLAWQACAELLGYDALRTLSQKILGDGAGGQKLGKNGSEK